MVERTIKTKFNVGDTVYPLFPNPVFCDRYLNFSEPYTINKITIKITEYETKILYELGIYEFEETDVFATNEEAEKECNRRNKKGG